MERQLRDLRNEHRLALREFEKLDYAASKRRATDADRQAAREQALVHFIDGLWGKYKVPLSTLQTDRDATATRLARTMGGLGYVG